MLLHAVMNNRRGSYAASGGKTVALEEIKAQFTWWPLDRWVIPKYMTGHELDTVFVAAVRSNIAAVKAMPAIKPTGTLSHQECYDLTLLVHSEGMQHEGCSVDSFVLLVSAVL